MFQTSTSSASTKVEKNCYKFLYQTLNRRADGHVQTFLIPYFSFRIYYASLASLSTPMWHQTCSDSYPKSDKEVEPFHSIYLPFGGASWSDTHTHKHTVFVHTLASGNNLLWSRKSRFFISPTRQYRGFFFWVAKLSNLIYYPLEIYSEKAMLQHLRFTRFNSCRTKHSWKNVLSFLVCLFHRRKLW